MFTIIHIIERSADFLRSSVIVKMGIKDNFQQALRELTGTEKEDPKQASKVDAMKNAVAASDDTSEFDAIRPKDDSSYDEIQRRAAAAAD